MIVKRQITVPLPWNEVVGTIKQYILRSKKHFGWTKEDSFFLDMLAPPQGNRTNFRYFIFGKAIKTEGAVYLKIKVIPGILSMAILLFPLLGLLSALVHMCRGADNLLSVLLFAALNLFLAVIVIWQEHACLDKFKEIFKTGDGLREPF